MIPVEFPQANLRVRPPQGLDESHCKSIPTFKSKILTGPHDGMDAFIVAWKPSEQDLQRLQAGENVYILFLGGIGMHLVATSFDEAAGVQS